MLSRESTLTTQHSQLRTPTACLRFETGPRAGEAIAINKSKVTFGRHLSQDVVLKHPTVSRDHFYVEFNAGKYFLIDQKSGNGTLVNGQPTSWIEIRHGDKIQAGPFVFAVELSDEEQQIARQTEEISDYARLESAQEDAPGFDDGHARLYPREYLEGIRHFNAGRYFEAHEIWEEIWLHASGDAKLFYQALIQAAVGMHHFEGGNVRGARGMRKNVLEKLERLPGVFMSLDLRLFKDDFESFLAESIDGALGGPGEMRRPRIHLLEGGPEEGSR